MNLLCFYLVKSFSVNSPDNTLRDECLVVYLFYQTEDADLIKNLNMYVLSRFYTKSYEENILYV